MVLSNIMICRFFRMVIKSSEVKLFVHVPYALVPDSDSSYTSGHKSATDVIPTMENKGEHQINNRERRMKKKQQQHTIQLDKRQLQKSARAEKRSKLTTTTTKTDIMHRKANSIHVVKIQWPETEKKKGSEE